MRRKLLNLVNSSLVSLKFSLIVFLKRMLFIFDHFIYICSNNSNNLYLNTMTFKAVPLVGRVYYLFHLFFSNYVGLFMFLIRFSCGFINRSILAGRRETLGTRLRIYNIYNISSMYMTHQPPGKLFMFFYFDDINDYNYIYISV